MRKIQRIHLRELLPPSIAHDPDIQAAADAIDAEINKTTHYIPNVAIINNLRNDNIEDSALINLLAWQYHVDFYDPDLSLEIRRELVAKSLDWHTRKGTPSVVVEVLRTVFSDADISEWFEYGGLPYRFKVGTEILLTGVEDNGYGLGLYGGGEYGGAEVDISSEFQAAIAKLIDAVYSVKNTRSWLEAIEIKRSWRKNIYVAVGLHNVITTTVKAHDCYDYGEGLYGLGPHGGCDLD